MQLLLRFAPLRPGEGDETQLERRHEGELAVADAVDLPEPVGRITVVAVTGRGADLGTVHGDSGTLHELLEQGWSRTAT